MMERLVAGLHAVAARLRRWWGEPRQDRGASALEWAVIAGIVVVAASVIGGAVYNIVDQKSQNLKTCANQPVGSSCSK
jgi:Flp pilus assembly pilin Flp